MDFISLNFLETYVAVRQRNTFTMPW